MLFDLQGKTIDPASTNLLIESVGTNRSLIISEVEKLLLFCADRDAITVEIIEALSGDPLGGNLDDLLDKALLGDLAGCTSRFRDLTASGVLPAQVLVMLSNQLTRLQRFRLDMDRGQNAEMVVKNARPPIFFKKQATTKRQLTIWHSKMLERALAIVFEAILLTRQNTNLAASICERALVTLSKTAQSNSR